MSKDELLILINECKVGNVDVTVDGFRDLKKLGYISYPTIKGFGPVAKLEITGEGHHYLVNDLGVGYPDDDRIRHLLKVFFNQSEGIENITMIEYLWLQQMGVINLSELNSTNVSYTTDVIKLLENIESYRK